MATKPTKESDNIIRCVADAHSGIQAECQQHENRDFVLWLTRRDGVKRRYRITRETFEDGKLRNEIATAVADLVSN